jgi:hypothetical protein
VSGVATTFDGFEMEASEKNQLPLDGSAVRALDDRLVIESLTVTDERAARVVRERAEAGHDPARTVTDAIEVGARVLDREGSESEVHYVRAEFERQAAQLAQRLERSLETGDERLAERIASSFDGERQGSVQQQIRELLGRALEEQRIGLMKQFSAEDGANPLTDFKGAVVRALKQLEENRREDSAANRKRIEDLTRELVELKGLHEADSRVAEAEEAGTRKGRDFEARVHDAVERIASARGDCAHHTGDQPAEGGGKKGDTVVEIGAADGPAQGRIVFEAKDKQGISKQSAWRELNGSLDRRAADFAVLVVAGEDQIPSGREPLHEYEGNKMIAAVHRDEPDGIELEAAYRLAVARVRMAKTRSLTVDAEGVRNSVESAVAALKEAQKIRSALTGAGKTIASVRESLDGMVAAVEQQLERIESLVAAAEEPG